MAADRVKTERNNIGVTNDNGNSLVSNSDTEFMSKTTNIIYIVAIRAFKNGFLLIL